MEIINSIVNFFTPPFDKNQTKVFLKSAIIRINLYTTRTREKVKNQKLEIINLVRNGKDELARIRVEHIIRDTEMIEAMELLHLFCERLQTRLDVLEISQTCPDELLETVHTLIYASPIVSEQAQELLKVKEQLSLKLGKEYVDKIACHGITYVNPVLKFKLAIKQADHFEVMKCLSDIVGVEAFEATFGSFLHGMHSPPATNPSVGNNQPFGGQPTAQFPAFPPLPTANNMTHSTNTSSVNNIPTNNMPMNNSSSGAPSINTSASFNYANQQNNTTNLNTLNGTQPSSSNSVNLNSSTSVPFFSTTSLFLSTPDCAA